MRLLGTGRVFHKQGCRQCISRLWRFMFQYCTGQIQVRIPVQVCPGSRLPTADGCDTQCCKCAFVCIPLSQLYPTRKIHYQICQYFVKICLNKSKLCFFMKHFSQKVSGMFTMLLNKDTLCHKLKITALLGHPARKQCMRLHKLRIYCRF